MADRHCRQADTAGRHGSGTAGREVRQAGTASEHGKGYSERAQQAGTASGHGRRARQAGPTGRQALHRRFAWDMRSKFLVRTPQTPH
jgi:hypothetical protein